MAVLSIVSKGWRSPEGLLAVSVNDGSGRSGYYVPGQNVVIDGAGRVIVPSSQIAGIETPSSVTPLNPLGPGLIAPAAPAAPAAPTCPTLVPGGSYKPTNSPARYVFLDGLLHLIPDPETATAHGWTGWVDADPSCFLASLIGPPIPSVKGAGGAAGGSGAPATTLPKLDPGILSGVLSNPLVLGGAALAGVLLFAGGRRRR